MEAQKETQDGDDDDDDNNDDDNKTRAAPKYLTLQNVGTVEDGGHRTLACLRSWLTPDHTN